jgi:hypothetical protein
MPRILLVRVDTPYIIDNRKFMQGKVRACKSRVASGRTTGAGRPNGLQIDTEERQFWGDY